MNILIVDQNHADRKNICGILENWGYHIDITHDANEALEKIGSDTFFIIADHETPGLNPLGFLKSSLQKNSDAKILFTSQTPSVENAVDAVKNGALDYIVKPVEEDYLRLTIDKIQQDKAPIKKTAQKKKTKIITNDPKMKQILEMIRQVADSTASIMVQGESGTGKELIARYIHENSNRSQKPFVAVNCAALPESLLESELFGHEKGAFTGAISRKAGKFELANSGTLLLDEITEMQVGLQSKLLRVIQEKEVDRVGGTTPISVDIRIIATTNRDIKSYIKEGEFREDLYYRLNVIPVHIPSLKERSLDIPILIEHFIKKFNELDGRNVKSLTDSALNLLKGFPFKGNVREMENIIHRAVLLCSGDKIEKKDLLLENGVATESSIMENQAENSSTNEEFLTGPLKEVEKKMIFHTLGKTEGNRTHAAKILGISVRTLRNKLNEYKSKQ